MTKDLKKNSLNFFNTSFLVPIYWKIKLGKKYVFERINLLKIYCILNDTCVTLNVFCKN